MSNPLAGLEPKELWHFFEMISRIPRGSGKEEQIQVALANLGEERALEVRRDSVGNVVLVIPATPGCEDSPPVVLQGHSDMVWEKNEGTDHDFETQGIKILRDGDWLTADGTTLGADNGVAVAASLALLDDPPGRHGPLELLFTVDEERGLTGACGIEPHMLQGRVLLNLDSEEEGFVTVGCAGGGDTLLELTGEREALPDGMETTSIQVKGLAGGHSGIDIHENRANSLRCLGRLLDRLGSRVRGIRLVALEGGSMRNAIPREASSVVAVPTGSADEVQAVVREVEAELKLEFGPTDPNLHLLVSDPPADGLRECFSAEFSARMLVLLLTTPSGVITMSRDIPGLPETSNNLGVVRMAGDTFKFVNCSRSSVKSALSSTRQGLRALGAAVGARVTQEDAYPGWQPDLDSSLLATFKRVHVEVTGKEPEVLAIHAGLECGVLGEAFPGMEMISIGPDMEAVHSPDERLNIPSTQRFYQLLKALLEALA